MVFTYYHRTPVASSREICEQQTSFLKNVFYKFYPGSCKGVKPE